VKTLDENVLIARTHLIKQSVYYAVVETKQLARYDSQVPGYHYSHIMYFVDLPAKRAESLQEASHIAENKKITIW